jgi:hypothetical protein
MIISAIGVEVDAVARRVGLEETAYVSTKQRMRRKFFKKI